MTLAIIVLGFTCAVIGAMRNSRIWNFLAFTSIFWLAVHGLFNPPVFIQVFVKQVMPPVHTVL